MFAPFIICLREGIEIFLVIIPLVVYFNKNKLYGMTKSALLGGALGTFIAAITGSIIFSQVALLDGPAGELFDGLLGIVLAGLVLYSVVLLRKNKSFNTTANQQFVSLSQKGVFILSAITFFRELLEVTLFILTGATTGNPMLIAGLSVLGLVSAAIIVYVVARGFARLNISVLFYILNLFLIGLGAYYFGDGLEVLFGKYVPEIFKMGILVYAVPSYYLMIKNDLKKYINSNMIK
ncbi:FTR1 family protein [Clostridium psychrophilum]|uniref:FTR1 family protein n=1 Tax=Clostridium psychrophilum TaxID=132926 RepID=UPI001C0D9CA6|nr:FTR1 family protein [Clostridium psychrophilum]MBU3181272.1 FTR1 family protein [Clostridium psychrophilum]